MLKVGDRLVIYNIPFPAYVESIVFDRFTNSTIIKLDWKEYGKSTVYGHDENVIWIKYINLN